MQDLPPTLTPMERQLLMRLQNLEEDLKARATAQDMKIAALEMQINERDGAITALTNSLKRLLGPLDQD